MTDFFAQATLGLQLMLAGLAAFIAFDFSKRLVARLTLDSVPYLAGASAALATALWSSTTLGLDTHNLPFDLGYHPALAIGVWLAASLMCSFGLAAGCRSGQSVRHIWQGAVALGAGLVASQALYIQALGLSPGVIWNTTTLGAALLAAAIGCAAALWFHAEIRARIRRGHLGWQAIPTLLLAATMVSSQALVIHAAALEGQTSSAWPGRISSDSMEMLATVGSLGLLLMLLLISQVEARLKASLQRAKGELEK